MLVIPYESKHQFDSMLVAFVQTYASLLCAEFCNRTDYNARGVLKLLKREAADRLFMGMQDLTFLCNAIDMHVHIICSHFYARRDIIERAVSKTAKALLSHDFMNQHFLVIDCLRNSTIMNTYDKPDDEQPIADRILSKHQWSSYQLAFMMLAHDRLGRNSTFGCLDPDLLRACLDACVYRRADIRLF